MLLLIYTKAAFLFIDPKYCSAAARQGSCAHPLSNRPAVCLPRNSFMQGYNVQIQSVISLRSYLPCCAKRVRKQLGFQACIIQSTERECNVLKNSSFFSSTGQKQNYGLHKYLKMASHIHSKLT